MHHVLIALNPRAGASAAGDRVRALVPLLQNAGLTASIESELGQLAAHAAQLHARHELRAVVAAGGDGTVAAVVNLLPEGVPVAIYPLGTENLLGRYLGQPSNPQAMLETLLANRVVRFDAARANGRLFLIMLSAGFDASVVERAHELRRGHITRWHYFRPIREALLRYRFPELRLTLRLVDQPQVDVHRRACWAFAFNFPRYAGGLGIARHALGNDGALDLTLFERGSIWHGLRYLGSVILGQHHRLADHDSLRVTRLRIEADEAVPYQIDGDPGGVLPVDVEVLPGRLSLMVPPNWN